MTIIYTSQNITCILKPLRCSIGSLMNPYYGGFVQILKKSVVHCNITILLLLNSVFSIEPGHTAAFGGKS